MSEKKEKQNKLAREIMLLSRNTLLVNLRFLDSALSQFEWIPIEGSTLLTDGKHLFYDPVHVLESYKVAKEIPVRDYLHIVMHCVFHHMYMDPSLNRPYWDLACDIAVAVAKKLLLPITSAVDLGTVPADLIGCFNLVFYQSAEDAVYKALGVE